MVGCGQNLGIWGGGLQKNKVSNVFIAHNAFLNTPFATLPADKCELFISDTSHTNVLIANNIIIQNSADSVVVPELRNYLQRQLVALPIAGHGR